MAEILGFATSGLKVAIVVAILVLWWPFWRRVVGPGMRWVLENWLLNRAYTDEEAEDIVDGLRILSIIIIVISYIPLAWMLVIAFGVRDTIFTEMGIGWAGFAALAAYLGHTHFFGHFVSGLEAKMNKFHRNGEIVAGLHPWSQLAFEGEAQPIETHSTVYVDDSNDKVVVPNKVLNESVVWNKSWAKWRIAMFIVPGGPKPLEKAKGLKEKIDAEPPDAMAKLVRRVKQDGITISDRQWLVMNRPTQGAEIWDDHFDKSEKKTTCAYRILPGDKIQLRIPVRTYADEALVYRQLKEKEVI